VEKAGDVVVDCAEKNRPSKRVFDRGSALPLQMQMHVSTQVQSHA